MEFCLIILSYLTLIVNGVFGDEVKSVSVMEGQNVTLHTDVDKHKDDLIVWYYGSENTFVARINRKADSTKYSDDERFKDRLKLNDQTGDLIITHITSQHSGLYKLKISSNNKSSDKRFNLTVSNFLPLNHITKQTEDLDNTELNNKSSESPDQRLIVITAVLCVIFITIITTTIIIIIYRKNRNAVSGKSPESKNHLNDEIRSNNSISSCEDEASRPR